MSEEFVKYLCRDCLVVFRVSPKTQKETQCHDCESLNTVVIKYS